MDLDLGGGDLWGVTRDSSTDLATDKHLLIGFEYTIFTADMDLFSAMRYAFGVGIEAAER